MSGPNAATTAPEPSLEAGLASLTASERVAFRAALRRLARAEETAAAQLAAYPVSARRHSETARIVRKVAG